MTLDELRDRILRWEDPYTDFKEKVDSNSGARCRRASREELLRLFQSAHSLFYDELPLPRLALADLDLDALPDISMTQPGGSR